MEIKQLKNIGLLDPDQWPVLKDYHLYLEEGGEPVGFNVYANMNLQERLNLFLFGDLPPWLTVLKEEYEQKDHERTQKEIKAKLKELDNGAL